MRAEHGPAGGPCCPRPAPPPRVCPGVCPQVCPRVSAPPAAAELPRVAGAGSRSILSPEATSLGRGGRGAAGGSAVPRLWARGLRTPSWAPPASLPLRQARPCVATPDSGRAGRAQTHTGAAQGDPEVTRVWNSWRKCLLAAGRLLGRCPVPAAVGRDSRRVPATPVGLQSPESPTVTRVGRRCGQGLCCVDGTHLEGDSAVYLRKNTNF